MTSNGGPTPRGIQADLVLRGARVWTGNRRHPSAEALAVIGDRIAAVGADAEIREMIRSRTQVLDAANGLALPGFIDNHVHLMMGGFQLLGLSLGDVRDEQQFVRRVADHAARLSPGQWLVGSGWDHQKWPNARLPQKEWIDPVTATTPVLLRRLDMHSALVNSVALRQAGITRETADPPGGEIVRDPATGEPTGILKDAAVALVERLLPPPSDEDADAALRAALKELARSGITSVQDITLWDHWDVYRRCHHRGELTVRIYARTPLTEWEKQQERLATEGPGDSWLRWGGVKGFADGSLGSATALFFEPYADAPHTCGLLHDQMFPEGIMKKRILAADHAGLQCSIHAIGDKANALVLDIVQEVIAENGLRDRRFRIEHAQHLRAEDIHRMARLNVIASVQPAHLMSDGCWAEKRIGRQRCRTSYAFRSLLDAGVMVTFGSDWPVAPLHPLVGICSAVTRRTADGKNPDGWIPEEKITVEEAIRAYTISNAFAEFAEGEKGSIEVGKLADVVVLSRDIFTVAPEEIPTIEITYTIVGGKVVYAR